ncbi:hypothetical protein TeGR_g11948 [Tetraparma gracilis]|uniref:Uncharacterized protein n=1 Tax=Tetraparma gracilis TaxID=2962635 RepID=A0ABQ6N8C3_9STRA|nr:hypothetical protein TeGR_g11948 [Tetraparma gracilis]
MHSSGAVRATFHKEDNDKALPLMAVPAQMDPRQSVLRRRFVKNPVVDGKACEWALEVGPHAPPAAGSEEASASPEEGPSAEKLTLNVAGLVDTGRAQIWRCVLDSLPELLLRSTGSSATSRRKVEKVEHVVNDTTRLYFFVQRSSEGVRLVENVNIIISLSPAAHGCTEISVSGSAKVRAGGESLKSLSQRAQSAKTLRRSLKETMQSVKATVMRSSKTSSFRSSSPSFNGNSASFKNSKIGRAVSALPGFSSSQNPSLLTVGADQPLEKRTALVLIEHFSGIVLQLQERFARDDEVDEATLRHFEEVIVPKAPKLNVEEQATLSLSSRFTDKDWTRIPNTVRDSVGYFRKIEDDSAAWGKAVTMCDASAARVMAYVWNQSTRRETAKESWAGRKSYGLGAQRLMRMSVEIPGSHSGIRVAGVRMPPGVDDRICSAWWVWSLQENGTFVCALAPYSGLGDCDATRRVDEAIACHQASKGNIHGVIRAFMKIKPLSTNVCRLEYVGQGNAGGVIPKMAMNMGVKSILSLAAQTESTFLRRAGVVDRELYDAAPLPPAFRELSRDQQEVIESCRKQLLDRRSRTRTFWQPWNLEPSPDALVRMWKQHPGDHSAETKYARLARVKSEGVVDASSKLVLAWWALVMSRVGAQEARERGDLALVTVKEDQPLGYDRTTANIRKVGFPFRPRELVWRTVCADCGSDGFVMASKSVSKDVKVDYGANTSAVRTEATFLVVIKLLPGVEDQCHVSFIGSMNAGGYIPVKVGNSKMTGLLSKHARLRAVFERDDEIDQGERDRAALEIKHGELGLTEVEQGYMKRVLDKLGAIEENKFEGIEYGDHYVLMSRAFMEGDSSVIGRASTVVDTSIEEAAAWEMCKMSREQLKEARTDAPPLARRVLKTKVNFFTFYQVVDIGIPGFKPRDFLMYCVWQFNADRTKLTVAYDGGDAEDDANFPKDSSYVRASCMDLWNYRRLPNLNGVPQTAISKITRVDIGGVIPKPLVNSGIAKPLSFLSTMRVRFDRTGELDGSSRRAVGQRLNKHRHMRNYESSYSSEELRPLNDGFRDLAFFKASKGTAVDLETISPTTTAQYKSTNSDHHAIGWATTVVAAHPIDVLAYVWDFSSRANFRAGVVEREVDEVTNDHSQIVYEKVKLPDPLLNRDFVSRMLWRQEEAASADSPTVLVVTTIPVVTAKRTRVKVNKGRARRLSLRISIKKMIDDLCVRGELPTTMRLTKLGERSTQVEYYISPNGGGSAPDWALKKSLVSHRLGYVTEIQQYFQQLRKMGGYDDTDAKAIGIRLMFPDVVKKHDGLKIIAEKYPLVVNMLEEAVRGELNMNKGILTKLDCLSAFEARRIGANLTAALRMRKTARAGVYQWQTQNPSMDELCRQYPWLHTTLVSMGTEILNQAPWGLYWRVITGSGISMIDLWSDVNVVYVYFQEGQEGFARAMVLMISASIFVQVLICIMQKGKESWRELVKDITIVALGLKPGVDALRLLTENKQGEHAKMDAKTELVATKLAELLCEAVPGCVLQCFALLNGGGGSTGAKFASITISALSTGIAAATISYDYDADPAARKENPSFYGYLPENGSARTVMFIALLLHSTLLLVIRSFASGLVLAVNSQALTYYMLGDMFLYMAQKVARGDMPYWLPVEGLVGVVFSLIMRPFTKIVTDFTALVQFRHSG